MPAPLQLGSPSGSCNDSPLAGFHASGSAALQTMKTPSQCMAGLVAREPYRLAGGRVLREWLRRAANDEGAVPVHGWARRAGAVLTRGWTG